MAYKEIDAPNCPVCGKRMEGTGLSPGWSVLGLVGIEIEWECHRHSHIVRFSKRYRVRGQWVPEKEEFPKHD